MWTRAMVYLTRQYIRRQAKLYVCLLRMCVLHVVGGTHACVIFKTSATQTHTHLTASLQKSMKNFSFRSASVPGDDALDGAADDDDDQVHFFRRLNSADSTAANALCKSLKGTTLYITLALAQLVVCSSLKIIIIYRSNTSRT